MEWFEDMAVCVGVDNREESEENIFLDGREFGSGFSYEWPHRLGARSCCRSRMFAGGGIMIGALITECSNAVIELGELIEDTPDVENEAFLHNS